MTNVGVIFLLTFDFT